jgi:hypothetical protein
MTAALLLLVVAKREQSDGIVTDRAHNAATAAAARAHRPVEVERGHHGGGRPLQDLGEVELLAS